jgi:hypothetical protein
VSGNFSINLSTTVLEGKTILNVKGNWKRKFEINLIEGMETELMKQIQIFCSTFFRPEEIFL